MNELSTYKGFLVEIRAEIQKTQLRTASTLHRELILLYWNLGLRLLDIQQSQPWGSGVIPRLARDLKNEMPEVKGFGERNLTNMAAFASEYGAPPIPQQLVAELLTTPETPLETLVLHLPWGHNLLLMQKVKDREQRRWYVIQTVTQGWSRNVLGLQIASRLHERTGQAITNFPLTLPPVHSDLAQQTLKDPYLFDFLTLDKDFRERELEVGLVRHLERFLLELGLGFAFVGRQVPLAIGNDDFYVDLLFYHLKLRCFVVIELKRGAFKPEYAGKLNFYLNAVDDLMRHPGDAPTIGLILCQDRNAVVAEYALRGVDKAIGVSEYQLTQALPNDLASSLPTIETLEAELSGEGSEA
ncbi:PDDEXK nuclease domain-containing protein [Holophaga foetida]|uniref:PDDEXK nuclease domain-containing protein n=1 Tax=Holophaga foetida TaxID=35839 RepID=UPI00024742BD|nr:PDDEXK nuclease domain-containing protein [Holophaga foetida]